MVGQCLWQLFFLEVDEIGQRHRERFWHGTSQFLGWCRCRSLPRFLEILIINEGHVQRMHAACSAQDGRFNVVRRHRLDRIQESPLIGITAQGCIHEHTATVLTRFLLQGQSNQVAEAALGHRVLVGEKSVIGFELELSGSSAGMADNSGAQSPGITGRHAARKENPCVFAVT